jgi:hypothetical protein
MKSEEFEPGREFPITKRISDPPAPDDFAAMETSDEDYEALTECRIGLPRQARCGGDSNAPCGGRLGQNHGQGGRDGRISHTDIGWGLLMRYGQQARGR